MRKHSAAILQKQPYTAPEVQCLPVQAPIGGWDAISPLAAMDPKNAVVLQNWVPRTGFIELRKGYQAWQQALTSGPIETLMAYRPPAASEKLFAAGGGSIWDVSTEGAATQVQSGISSNRWQYVNFTPAGGSHYLYAVNGGSDSPLLYDGTTWSNPTISGVSSGTLISINVHKRRIWFIQANSTSAWYLATDAVTGGATQLDVGSLMPKGGFLVVMATWTLDGGFGPDDYAAFISSRGEVVVYKGTDPANANTWSLVGTFTFPPPLGRRCYYDMGSDVWMITQQGIIPMSQGLPFDPSADRSVAVTNKIQNAMLQAAQLYKDNFGWQVLTYPAQGLAILNVPIATNSQQNQFVMNLLTGAWCQFTGWNANCFEIFNDTLYFGGNTGDVNLAWNGIADLVSPVVADMKCAFNYFGDPGRNKRVAMVQPFIVSSGLITPTISIDVNFADSSPSAPVTQITPTGAVWDASLWDSATWGGGTVALVNWLSAEAQGQALAIRMKVNVGVSSNASSSVFDTGVFDGMVFDAFFGTSDNSTLQVNAFNALVEYGANV